MYLEKIRIFDQLNNDIITTLEARSPEWLHEKLQVGSFVYGAGNFGRRVAALLREKKFPCCGFIDRRGGAEFKILDGFPVIHPDALTPQICAGRNFILGIFNPFDDMGEIVDTAHTYGFDQIFWGSDLPDGLGASLGEFWLSGRQVFLDNFDRIRALGNVLADETSIRTLETIIRFRALGQTKLNPVPSFGRQYLPQDLPGFDRPISFLDGGAYDGDSFRSLTGFGVEISRWIAFEPDPANFASLVAFGKHCRTSATFIPCGISDQLQQVTFAAGNQTGSRILDDQTAPGTIIQCLAIDDAFHGIPVDYVKLDIEGAESSALRGMTKTLQKYQPRLAISAYHRPHDLWEIPLQIKDILPDHDLYIRHHYPNTYEVVAYAIPSKPR